VDPIINGHGASRCGLWEGSNNEHVATLRYKPSMLTDPETLSFC
jgi:hypothetical protein